MFHFRLFCAAYNIIINSNGFVKNLLAVQNQIWHSTKLAYQRKQPWITLLAIALIGQNQVNACQNFNQSIQTHLDAFSATFKAPFLPFSRHSSEIRFPCWWCSHDVMTRRTKCCKHVRRHRYTDIQGGTVITATRRWFTTWCLHERAWNVDDSAASWQACVSALSTLAGRCTSIRRSQSQSDAVFLLTRDRIIYTSSALTLVNLPDALESPSFTLNCIMSLSGGGVQ